MHPRRSLRSLLLAVAGFAAALPARAQFVISEFMASNKTTLHDENGDNPDWVEIHNEGAAAASLEGWYLTDTAGNLTEWQFPAVSLPSNGYLVVFASGKDRRTAGSPLHTNFKLSPDGEYLGLVKPDGVTVASELAPAYPLQVEDVSYGVRRDAVTVPLLTAGSPARAFVPPDNSLALTWTVQDFDDSAWPSGTTGIGYDRQAAGVNFLPLIGLNVEAAMYPSNPTLYARIPFTVVDPTLFTGLTLRIQYDDGFVAYLNGQEIARDNAPAAATWNSPAVAPRTDTSAIVFRDFDITAFRGHLTAGTNILSFQALNNPANSPDLLLVPELVGFSANGPPVARYFSVPTPGSTNNPGVATVGPVFRNVQSTPGQPAASDVIAVTAELHPAFAPVASATLHYVVMFGSEVTVPFLDDGNSGDGASGDGVYGARIPAGTGAAGQMVRWYLSATDTSANASRHPAYPDPVNTPAYLGTVIANPALTNPLPVFHWFVQNVAATNTTTGTRCSVNWNGEFYDNVFCRVRGATAPQYARKPYKFDFNPGDHLRFLPGQPRADELNLNTTYQDKAFLRAPLAFETYRNAGVPACDAFNVRVQQNGAFFSVAVFTEQVDTTFLSRRGLDPDGALYKLTNGVTSSAGGVEKKTRRTENNADLQAVVTGLSPTNPNRAAFVFDNMDLPEVVNYLAAGTVAQDFDRMIKNFYLYRDTAGTQQWKLLPWDKDLSFGLFGLQCDNVAGNDDAPAYTGTSGGYISHPLVGTQARNFVGHINYLFDAVYNTPATKAMYLRRLRTLMDQMLQPPGTPAGQLWYEQRIDELSGLLQPDATLNLTKWGAGFGQSQTLGAATGAIKNKYLPQRRTHLYQTHNIANAPGNPGVAGIPNSQAAGPALTFGAVEFNPPSGNPGQEYIELINGNADAVDLSGWSLEGAASFTFAPGTVVPASARVYVSPNLVAFRSRTAAPRAGQSLLVVGNYDGHLSARGGLLTLRSATGATVATTNFSGAQSPAQQFLRITELMVHPATSAGSPYGAEEFEFIELKNTSAATMDLNGVRLISGVSFNFTGSAITSLAPGATVLVVKNTAAFISRYGSTLPVAGQYTGSLENQGERLQLLDAAGEAVLDFAYDRWYPITDGHGFSLAAVDEHASPASWNLAAYWRRSSSLGGSPGAADPALTEIPPVIINEVLSRSDTPPLTDSIELLNPAASPANVGGWFLTDDFNTPQKFRIPDGTIIPAGGYIVFTEADFNAGGNGFAFSSDGDEAWLFSAGAQDALTGYVHGFAFGAAEDGVSFGRVVNSQSVEQFVAQSTRTPGGPNASPLVGPVVISEIHYQPSLTAAAAVTAFNAFDVLLNQKAAAIAATADRLEFIEIQNITAASVPLFDPAHPANTWRLRGDADFDFPAGLTLPAGGTLLIVNFDPVADPASLTTFRAAWGLDPSTLVIGPFSGKLNNGGARVELQRPDVANPNGIPHPVVDSITYGSGWTAASGNGLSLQRKTANGYGDDPLNWAAAAPSPGIVPTASPVPSIASVRFEGGTFTIDFTTAAGYNYRIEASSDLASWQQQGPLRPGTGSVLSAAVSAVPGSHFYRVARVP